MSRGRAGAGEQVLARRAGAVGVLLVVFLGASGCSSSSVPILEARGEPGSADLTLSVTSCRQDPVAEVEETDTEVRVTVTTQQGENGDECSDGLVVALDEPIGDRDLVDGDTGERVRLKPPEPRSSSALAGQPTRAQAA